MTLVQRFGSALNLNIHFHMLFLDGVNLADGANPPVFRHVSALDTRVSGLLTWRGGYRVRRESCRCAGRGGFGVRAGVISDRLAVRRGMPAAGLTIRPVPRTDCRG